MCIRDRRGLVFIVGKSGCGKTTLLNILAGMDTADEGDITVDGKNFKDFSPSDYDEYRNIYVGLVFQEYNLIEIISPSVKMWPLPLNYRVKKPILPF